MDVVISFRFTEERDEFGYPILVATATHIEDGQRPPVAVSGPAARIVLKEVSGWFDRVKQWGRVPLRIAG